MQKMNASCSTQHGRGRAQRRHPSARRTGTVTQGLAQARHHWHCTLYEMSSAALMGPANRAENTVLARRKSRAGSQSGRRRGANARDAQRARATRGSVLAVRAAHHTAGNTTIQSAARRAADSAAGAMPSPGSSCAELRLVPCRACRGSHEVKVDMSISKHRGHSWTRFSRSLFFF